MSSQAPKTINKHRLTEDNWQTIFAYQGEKCAICKTKEPGERGWNVDHDHACCTPVGGGSCGRCIRGILCGRCNCALGLFGDDPRVLMAAYEYLNGAEPW